MGWRILLDFLHETFLEKPEKNCVLQLYLSENVNFGYSSFIGIFMFFALFGIFFLLDGVFEL